MRVDRQYNEIRSKEIKHLKGFIHSQNADGSFNVCFNTNLINPTDKHLHRYTKDYLEQFYEITGTVIKWSIQ
jgi:hypothetical protein